MKVFACECTYENFAADFFVGFASGYVKEFVLYHALRVNIHEKISAPQLQGRRACVIKTRCENF